MHNFRPKTLFVGNKSIYLPTCQSTNDEAALLLRQESVAEGTLIVTDYQTAGRGQRGNQWLSQPAENLTFSLILKPSFLIASEQFCLNVAVSLGVFDGLEPLLGDGLKIKWPNDLYFKNQKLGGILIENNLQGSRLETSIVGIGLNVNQINFENLNATSLRCINGKTTELPELLGELLIKLEENYLLLRNGHYNRLKMRYLHNLFRYQEQNLFQDAQQRTFAGTIMGINETGKLAINSQNKLHYFDFKEISYVI